MTGRHDDVVTVILEDHRRMEDLLRRMRSVEADRAQALEQFAALLVAHGEAEESQVYGALKRFENVDDEEVEHGAQEHAEGNAALLDLLEVPEIGSAAWDTRLEALAKTVSHHLDEEERTILNGARENVPGERRRELGAAFLRERERHLAADCGSPDAVRALVRG
ncbi:hemerythrin domain-containing protein [Streptomyces sp. NPDC048566]|uniref:hemerythrin domain-containing protein n=1 Tax=Streptomyces sp. NPDC048566 TaxID=3365569 RepID=UPI0037183047